MTDIAKEIWTRCIEQEPPLDLKTAEDRARLDRSLRGELTAIADEHLRSHVAEILRGLRRRAFGHLDGEPDLRAVIARVQAIEAHLGLAPIPPKLPREITGLTMPGTGGKA